MPIAFREILSSGTRVWKGSADTDEVELKNEAQHDFKHQTTFSSRYVRIKIRLGAESASLKMGAHYILTDIYLSVK